MCVRAGCTWRWVAFGWGQLLPWWGLHGSRNTRRHTRTENHQPGNKLNMQPKSFMYLVSFTLDNEFNQFNIYSFIFPPTGWSSGWWIWTSSDSSIIKTQWTCFIFCIMRYTRASDMGKNTAILAFIVFYETGLYKIKCCFGVKFFI